MAKKPNKPAPKAMTSNDLRKRAAEHRAKARLHEAKADMLDIKSPPKEPRKHFPSGY